MALLCSSTTGTTRIPRDDNRGTRKRMRRKSLRHMAQVHTPQRSYHAYDLHSHSLRSILLSIAYHQSSDDPHGHCICRQCWEGSPTITICMQWRRGRVYCRQVHTTQAGLLHNYLPIYPGLPYLYDTTTTTSITHTLCQTTMLVCWVVY